MEEQEVSFEELVEIVKALQSHVNDLRWRVNKLCNHLHTQEAAAACCALHAGGYEECK